MAKFYQKLSPPSFVEGALRASRAALKSGQWANGPRARILEERIAREIGVEPSQVIATSSCTAALAAAKDFLLKDGAARVSPLSWTSTFLGLKEISWVDCSAEGPVAPVDIGVQLWGRKCTFPEPPIILDAAHRACMPEHGQMLREGVKAVCYSFGPTKEVACWGGGALVLREGLDDGLFREWLDYGASARRLRYLGGMNGLIDDVSAAFLNQQLKRLPCLRARRRRVLELYAEHFAGLMLTRPDASGHLAVIDCQAAEVRRLYEAALGKKPSIQHSRHYPIPKESIQFCPGAAELSSRALSLPCHDRLSPNDVRRVVMRILAA